MKKTILLILNLLLLQSLFSQQKSIKKSRDPFCQMVETIYAVETVSFRSQFKMKQVFEKDTSSTFANVTVGKKGTSISFLRIIAEGSSKELLYCNDSVWIINHENKKMTCLGTTFEQAMYTELAAYFPQSLYTIDTLISYTEPYWKVIKKNRDQTVVSLTISNAPAEISDMRAEFTIGNRDLLPYRTVQESVYMKADNLYQEQVFSGYTFPGADQMVAPDYFAMYEKDRSHVSGTNMIGEYEADTIAESEYLPDIQLRTISGQPYSLPDSGLIFLDFWYVGCPPCMKSALIIENLYGKYKEEVHFFSVNETDSDTAKINLFKDKMGITFTVLLGGKEKIAWKLTGNGGYPVFILMDGATRKILWKFTGYIEGLEDRITGEIDRLL